MPVACYSVAHSLSITQDPFVEAIGSIEFNEDAAAFVVSGYTESVVSSQLAGTQAVHAHLTRP